MWYKVHELTERGLNKSQIREATGLDRATIRKYQQIDETSFHTMLIDKRKLPKKLHEYRNYIKVLLQEHPYLSSAQVEDRLKEHYHDLPSVHSKTVYNFVQAIREEFNISKPITKGRVFEKLPEPEYGHQAQVDFGQTWLQTPDNKRKKVYFFTMVLSRSRYKYVYLTDKPFTTRISVEAHHFAFEFFGGVPRGILYDQDSVFIHDENLGDYQLTHCFSSFCKSQDFKAVFCRKADPQSKGKVENVVKYVKQNFLRGRKYVNIELLNKEVLSWLSRTANAKIHSGTRLIPMQQWEQEKPFLLPIKPRANQPKIKSYKVRKDNTVMYRSNYYSLPLGTYSGSESCVLLEADDTQLHIYSPEKELICNHTLSVEQGKTIRNSDHKRPKSETLEKYEQDVLNLLGNSEIAKNYLDALHKNKSRYYRDNLVYILKNYGTYQNETITKGLLYCAENEVFNASSFIEVMEKTEAEISAKFSPKPIKPTPAKSLTGQSNPASATADYKVETSDITNYERFFN